jgi:hypothetical protein
VVAFAISVEFFGFESDVDLIAADLSSADPHESVLLFAHALVHPRPSHDRTSRHRPVDGRLKTSTQNSGSPMPGYGQESCAISYLLAKPVIAPLVCDSISQLSFFAIVCRNIAVHVDFAIVGRPNGFPTRRCSRPIRNQFLDTIERHRRRLFPSRYNL